MFTGIIQGKGEIIACTDKNGDKQFRVRPLFALSSVVRGESIALNGMCMTVENFVNNTGTQTCAWYECFASAQSLSVTTLGSLAVGSVCNVERAMAFGDRVGGHLVSGHVDCVAKITAIHPVGASIQYRIEFPEERKAEVITKGSVTLDGISLTITACGDNYLEVNCIPETQNETTLSSWKVNTLVNFETDLLGKYVSSTLQHWIKQENPTRKNVSNITESFLQENGFL